MLGGASSCDAQHKPDGVPLSEEMQKRPVARAHELMP